MSRVPRTSLPDGYYHVTARGVDRTTPLFCDEADRAIFFGLAARTVERFDWTCHALCVMSTHYHLVLESTRPQLSSGLQWLNCGYATQFNRRHGRFGHVFANRFSARAIESEEYLRQACAYVLLNPVAAGVSERIEDWPWSFSRYGPASA